VSVWLPSNPRACVDRTEDADKRPTGQKSYNLNCIRGGGGIYRSRKTKKRESEKWECSEKEMGKLELTKKIVWGDLKEKKGQTERVTVKTYYQSERKSPGGIQ